ncbi:MAG: Fe-S cluster assembly protein SufD [Caldilineaceae bacterium]|nr:Fe-S cluster assembly protein SufD [Caldilineaceae bacterium]
MNSVNGFSEETVRAHSSSRNEPDWMLDFRLQAWREFEAMPWPTATDEAWRRTRLTGFDLANFRPFAVSSGRVQKSELSTRLQNELDEMDSAASMVFEDGSIRFSEYKTDLNECGVIFADLHSAVQQHPDLVRKYFMTEAVKPGLNKFTALHAALWDSGTFIFVPANARCTLPLQVILSQSSGVGSYHHTLLVAEQGAEVTVVDDLLGGTDGLQVGVVEIVMGDGSVVRYMNLQDFDHSTWNFLTGRAVMGRDTDLRWIQVSWGSRLTKAFLDVDLMGEGGHAELLGIYFPIGNQHIDHQTLQIHRAPHCFSDLLFNGALKDKSRSVYMGFIKVYPRAQKTDAYQRNGNLILDPTARADSIPGLEIEADDVRCTHGATAAQVEDEYVFYLMARGLSRAQAERMIVQGFFQAVLDRVPVESVVHKLEQVVERKIGG